MTVHPLPTDAFGRTIEQPLLDWANGDKLAYTDTAGQSPAFTTDLVYVCSDQDCLITMGSDPTATDGDDSFLVPANTPLWFAFISGQKISAVRKGASSGSLYIAPAVAVTIS